MMRKLRAAMTTKRFTKFLRTATALFLLAITPATAQVASTELFKPAVTINGKAVTNFEVQQRIVMLRLFRTPGNLQKQALEGLIDDRLRLIAAERMNLSVTEEEVRAGEEEFAGRANLSREEFLTALQGAGVAPESFRDFVTAGLLWRQVVRDRFAANATVNQDEIDAALSPTTRRTGAVKVLFSEIILPANTPAAAAASERRAAEIVANVRGEAAFASYARRFSASPSRARGGRVAEAVPLANLPPQIGQALLALPSGGITDPFPIPNAIAIFQLRELIQTRDPEFENLALEYARFLIPGGRTEDTLRQAAKLRARVDTCNDLYAVAKGLPPERLTRDIRTPGEIPADIALELAKLDPGESSTALTSGNALVFLMLCARKVALQGDGGGADGADGAQPDGAAPQASAEGKARPAGESNDARISAGALAMPEISTSTIREQVINQKVGAQANRYLAELKANAIITYP